MERPADEPPIDPDAARQESPDTPRGDRSERRRRSRRRRHRSSDGDHRREKPEPTETGDKPTHRDEQDDAYHDGRPRKKRRRRRKKKSTEREFHPYSRPKSRHHESRLLNAWKAATFALRANLSWLKRRLKRGAFGRRKHRDLELPKPRRRFNLRVVAFTASLGLAIYFGVPLWQKAAVQRSSAGILERARGAFEAEQWEDAANAANQYAQLHLHHPEALVLLARSYARVAKTPNMQPAAAEHYRNALLYDPDNADLHREFARYLLASALPDRHFGVEAQADYLLRRSPDDPEAWRMKALAAHGLAENGEGPVVGRAIEALKSATQHNPADAGLARKLADLYRSNVAELWVGEGDQAANEVMDRLVQLNLRSAEALIARYQYRLVYGVPGLDADLDSALLLAPDSPEVLIAAGERGLRRRQFVEARGFFNRLLSISPQTTPAHLGLARAYLGEGQFDQAVELLERARREGAESDLRVALLLVESLTAAGNTRKAHELLEQTEAAIRTLPTDQPLYDRRDLRTASEFARAELLLADQDFPAAVAALKRLAAPSSETLLAEDDSDLTRSSPSARRVHELLANSYAALGQWADAARVYEAQQALAPREIEPALSAVRAWLAAEEPQRAEVLLAKVAESPLLAGPRRADWATALLELEAARPAGQRHWQTFDGALAAAREELGRTPAVALVEARKARLEGRLEEAATLLRDAHQTDPRSPGVAEGLVEIELAAGNVAAAERVLRDVERDRGAAEWTAVARAQLLRQQGRPEEAVQSLRQQLERTTAPRARQALSRQLARLHLALGQVDAARQVLREMLEAFPKNRQLLEHAVELAIEAGDEAEMSALAAQLREAYGGADVLGKYLEAMRALEGPKPSDEQVEAAAVRLADVLEARPGWPATHVLAGTLAERLGAPSRAIASYRQALRHSDQTLPAYSRLFALLLAQGRAVEAAELLASFEHAAEKHDGLAIGSSTSAALPLELATARQLAAGEARRRADDPWPRVWLAHLLMLSESRQDAQELLEQTLAKISDRAAQATTRLVAATRSSAGPKNMPLDAKTTERIVEPVTAPLWLREFLLAQAAELSEDPSAASHYRQAWSLARDNLDVARQVARYFVQRDPPLVEEILSRALDANTAQGDLRQALATLLAARGRAVPWTDAWDVAFDPRVQPEELVDDHGRMVALARRGSVADIDQVIEWLDRRGGETDEGTDDAFVLALAREQRGKLKEARDGLVRVLADHKEDEALVRIYVDFLLRHGYADDAAPWLADLERRAGATLATLSARARWLKAQSRGGEIEALVEARSSALLEAAEDETHRRQIGQSLAAIYVTTGNAAAAERAYRKLIEADRQSYEPFALWLATQGRTAEAVDACLAAVGNNPTPPMVASLARVLIEGRASEAEYRKADALLARVEELFPIDADALLAAARVAQHRLQDDRAIALLRRALDAAPQLSRARATLAVLLSSSGQKVEATTAIERALQGASQDPDVLDARGMVLMNLGPLEEATAALAEATRRPDAQGVHFLHLAQALERGGKLTEARTALTRARALGLSAAGMLPSDRRLAAQLEQTLQP